MRSGSSNAGWRISKRRRAQVAKFVAFAFLMVFAGSTLLAFYMQLTMTM